MGFAKGVEFHPVEQNKVSLPNREIEIVNGLSLPCFLGQEPKQKSGRVYLDIVLARGFGTLIGGGDLTDLCFDRLFTNGIIEGVTTWPRSTFDGDPNISPTLTRDFFRFEVTGATYVAWRQIPSGNLAELVASSEEVFGSKISLYTVQTMLACPDMGSILTQARLPSSIRVKYNDWLNSSVF